MTINLALTRCIQSLLFAYPILLLTVKGGMSTSFFLLLALSLYLIFVAEKGSIRQEMDRVAVLVILAMSTTFISVLLTQIYHMDGSARDFDSVSRFLFAVPIFLVLRNMDSKLLGIIQYGFPAGAILIFIIIWMSGQHTEARSYFNIHIHLGDLALMLGFLSIFSINWTQKDSPLLAGIKALGLVAGLYVSLVSGARGGWAAIPVFFLVWILTTSKFKHGVITRLSIAAIVMVLVAIVSYLTVNTVHIRLDAAISDLTTTNPDTSLGIRFQLWKAAIQLFMQNPILGVGADGFGRAMDMLSDSGLLTKLAADIGKGEVHSYYFAILARFGIVGVISTLLLFGIPLRLFYRALSSHHDSQRVAARMGLTLVLGFIVFCVSVEMFNLKMVATFYGVTLAVLLAAATNSRVERSTG